MSLASPPQALLSIVCASAGFLSPANRGGLLTATLLLFVLMGVPAGYTASITYKCLKGAQWKTLTLLTAFLYPGIVFIGALFLNFFIWGRGSSGDVPFGTIVALICMWFCISVPLVFCGAFFGFKQGLLEPPVRTNEIPRQIPAQACHRMLRATACCVLLPLGRPLARLPMHRSMHLLTYPCTVVRIYSRIGAP